MGKNSEKYTLHDLIICLILSLWTGCMITCIISNAIITKQKSLESSTKEKYLKLKEQVEYKQDSVEIVLINLSIDRNLKEIDKLEREMDSLN